MLPDCKITEIFFICDEFSKYFDHIVSKFPITENIINNPTTNFVAIF